MYIIFYSNEFPLIISIYRVTDVGFDGTIAVISGATVGRRMRDRSRLPLLRWRDIQPRHLLFHVKSCDPFSRLRDRRRLETRLLDRSE